MCQNTDTRKHSHTNKMLKEKKAQGEDGSGTCC